MNRFIYWISVAGISILSSRLSAQIGYYDAPFIRYEANSGNLVNATATTQSHSQADIQSEASGQVCVSFSNAGASVDWTLSQQADGLVLRYSVPDGETSTVEVFADNVSVGTLLLTSTYSWEYLATNGNPNNNGASNLNPRMRFDEVRMKLPSKILSGGNLKLVRVSGNIYLDFVELEEVPAAVPSLAGEVVYGGDGSDLQTFINTNGNKTIYLPSGTYNVNRELYFGVNNTKLKGAGMWYTQIHFTNTNGGQGGLRANASNVGFSGLYLTTVRNSRASSYKGINGVFTAGSIITDVWTEHFECGAWIGQYNTGTIEYADGFTISNCRFRNSYADGINLCKGTRNTVVEHCSFRNNGDDDMAIWSASGLECMNNTYRYNTSENCWRSAGLAIYGGLSNSANNLLFRDNLEAAIKINNSFSGVEFNDAGVHELHDITIIACGTFNDLYNSPIGAIDISCTNICGTRIKNVKFSNITITNSRNDAIYINKKSGEGFYNLIFENITVNGTGVEYPNNNINGLNWGRGYGILFVGYPSGNGTYCNMTYSNRGGNATTNVNSAQIGTFNWTLGSCTAGYSTSMTSGNIIGLCDQSVTLSATTTGPAGNTADYVEFFVDNVSIGQDVSSPYSMTWNSPSAGEHQIKSVAHYSPSNYNATSLTQFLTAAEVVYPTSSTPTLDGVIESMWSEHKAHSMNLISQGTVTNSSDLSAYFKITRDANNLYVLVDVTDDILRNDGTANWQKDGVEIYIDMGNDKTGTYIANNDFQYSLVWNVNTAQAGITFAQTTKAGNLGYIVELSIPWTTLGGMPAMPDFMGFDVHVEDNDSGTRNGKKAWKDAADNAWQSTTVLGTLQLANCTNPLVTGVLASETNEEISFFPNPFRSNGTLQLSETMEGAYSVQWVDAMGRIVSSEKTTGKESMLGEGLPPGVYVLEVSDGTFKRSIRILKY